MRVVFWGDESAYERTLGPAMQAGAALHGDSLEIRPTADYREPVGDLGVIVGVVKREILWGYQRAGRTLAYLDKGYARSWLQYRGENRPQWWRLCVNDTHPTAYFLQRPRARDRWDLLDDRLRHRRHGAQILIAGSSEKYHHTHGLSHPTAWARDVVEQVRQHSDRPIIYRPKPSWRGAVAVAGATFDHPSEPGFQVFKHRLENVFCTVTHGSGASVESIIRGVPCVVLGHAIARPISSTTLAEIENPRWPDQDARQGWANAMAYCQWRITEFEDGTAWTTLKEQIDDAERGIRRTDGAIPGVSSDAEDLLGQRHPAAP